MLPYGRARHGARPSNPGRLYEVTDRHMRSTDTMKTMPCVLGLLLLTSSAQAGIIFQQDFEDGLEGCSEGFETAELESCCEHSVQNVTSHAYQGERSLLTQVLYGDAGSWGHAARANLRVPTGTVINGTAVLPYRTDRWFGFATYVPRNDMLGDNHIFNTHTVSWGGGECVPAGGSPISMRIFGPNRLWNEHGHVWVLFENHEKLYLADAEDDLDTWTQWVVHMNLDYRTRAEGGVGILEIWKNGENIHQNDDFNLSEYPVPESCGHFYPKIGSGAAVLQLKEGPDSVTFPLEVYYDSIRWGDEESSYQEVDPAQDIAEPGAGGGGGIGGAASTGGAGASTGGSAGLGAGGTSAGSGGDGAEPCDECGGGCAFTGRSVGGAALPFGLAVLGAALAGRRRRRASQSGTSA